MAPFNWPGGNAANAPPCVRRAPDRLAIGRRTVHSSHAALRPDFPLRFGPRFACHDAIDSLRASFFGHERQAEPLAHHACEEAADRVLLPIGRLHDGHDGCALPALQHLDDAGLFRIAWIWLSRLLASVVFA